MPTSSKRWRVTGRVLGMAAKITVTSWLLSVLLLLGEHYLQVVHPWSVCFLLVFFVTVLAGVSGICFSVWSRWRRGAVRHAGAWECACLLPLFFWLALGVYAYDLSKKNQWPKNVLTDLVSMTIASLMEFQAEYVYPQRMESDRLVMFFDDRVTEPERDLHAMDEHVRQLEQLTGLPLRGRIHWVRGELLGRSRLAVKGLALGSTASPEDWSTAAHPEGLSVDRHELAHAILHQHQPPTSAPPMVLVEGWAEFQSGTSSARRAQWAKDSRQVWRERTGAAATDSYLRDFIGPDGYYRLNGGVYSVGGALVDYLVRHYGMERFLALYFDCGFGHFDEDCQQYLGNNLHAIEAAFWQDVDEQIAKETPPR